MSKDINKKDIYKPHEVLESQLCLDNNIHELKLLDRLYSFVESHTMTKREIDKNYIFDKPFELNILLSDMRIWLNLQKNEDYKNIIDNTLLKLDKKIIIKNVKIGKDFIEMGSISFIQKWFRIRNEENDKSVFYRIIIDNDIFNLIDSKNLFTKMEHKQLNKLTRANSYKLYQVLKKWEKATITKYYYIEDLKNIFVNNKDFKYMSEFIRMINTALKQINKETDLKGVVVYEKDKKRLRLKVLSRKVSKIEKEKEEDAQIIDNLVNS